MEPLIRVEDIAHVRFTAPDLPCMAAFLQDFGLSTFEDAGVLYARGLNGAPFLHATGPGEPGFAGLGLRAASIKDLARLAAAEGVTVEPFQAPGGGHVVSLRDPDGNLVEIVAGQAWESPPPPEPEWPFNSAADFLRSRRAVRTTPGPSHIFRLGHCVLNVADFRRSENWYKARFGFITSDEIEASSGVAMGAFMRCDRGDQPSDHHTLFLAQLPSGPGFNHAAFEVLGLNDLMLGHDHLRTRKHKAAWGVGRHILGSQIFDYWKDPWGHELEHWTDGDRFTADDGSNVATVDDLLSVQWGSPHPMFARRLAPSPRTIGRLMALNVRARRLFRFRQREKTA
ncbi:MULTISPECIES: VOC family protein [unclassified Sphingomonas]|uniref:VOC family protein n=1 Tax=unclassified Sphingomonas TaxID=196159 RepID=UPI001E3125F4|nr:MULTISPECIES: VOC family protein [unclassified Sphingomonas]